LTRPWCSGSRAMVRLAIKNLFQERGRLLLSLSGVAMALLLVLLLEGIFAGTSEQIVAYPQETDADVWVMQEGVSNMHMTTSILPGNLEEAIPAVPGVEEVTSILYVNNFVEVGEKWFSYGVGLKEDTARGGPWEMAEGADSSGPGEVIIPDVLARKGGVGLGDNVTIMNRQFRVVGLSKGTFSMANSITFVSYSDLEELLSAPGAASYFLVTVEPGSSPETMAESIRQAIPGINAMSKNAFVSSDRSMAIQMGVDIIRVMTLVGFAVGALVIGLTMYTTTVRRAREYGIAKALGARNRYLLALVMFQTLVIAFMGLGIAVALAYLARPLITALVPEIALVYPVGSLIRLGLASLIIASLAALLPAYRITRVEPGIVFRE